MFIETAPSLPSKTRITLVRSDISPLEIKPEVEQLTFGKQLVLLRKQFALSRGIKEFSQRQLASEAGIDHSTISRLEKGKIKDPKISVVASLAEALKPEDDQTLCLIASLAKERDRAYINDLSGLSDNSPNRPTIPGLNIEVSKPLTPVGKAIDYKKRRGGKDGRNFSQIARLGGIDKSSVSRFFSGKITDISGYFFTALVIGLGLRTREQVLDFFYSFGAQGNDSAASMLPEAVEQKLHNPKSFSEKLTLSYRKSFNS